MSKQPRKRRRDNDDVFGSVTGKAAKRHGGYAVSEEDPGVTTQWCDEWQNQVNGPDLLQTVFDLSGFYDPAPGTSTGGYTFPEQQYTDFTVGPVQPSAPLYTVTPSVEAVPSAYEQYTTLPVYFNKCHEDIISSDDDDDYAIGVSASISYTTMDTGDASVYREQSGTGRFEIAPEQEEFLNRGLRNIEHAAKTTTRWDNDDLTLYDCFAAHTAQVPGDCRVHGGDRRDYRLYKIERRRHERLGVERARFKLILEHADPSNILTYEEERENLRKRIQSILDEVKRNVDPQDWFGLELNNPQFKDGAVFIRKRRADQLDAEALLAEFDKAHQSYGDILFQDLFTLSTIRIEMPAGGKNRTRKWSLAGQTMKEFLKSKKRSLIYIDNADDICLARAVVVAKAHADDDQILCTSLQINTGTQRKEAMSLLTAVCIPERICTLEDVKKIAEHMPDYQFMVRDMFDFLYQDPVKKKKQIILFYDSEAKHFHVLTSLKGFLGRSYFCFDCNARYDDKSKHKCTRGCKMCGAGDGDCRRVMQGITCSECNRFFYNKNCLENHKIRGICERLFRCKLCKALVNKRTRGSGQLKDHQCGEMHCQTCRGYYPNPHECYMKPIRAKGLKIGGNDDDDDDDVGIISYDLVEEEDMLMCKNNGKFLFIFYDFEATQEKKFEDSVDTFEHVVNYVVAKHRCMECVQDNLSTECDTCGVRKLIFKGETALQDFIDHIFGMKEMLKKDKIQVIAIAHNSSGYDGQFILQHCVQRGVKPSKILAAGTKIMAMTVGDVKFADSFKFIPMALSKIPSAFDLEDLKKGDFPHMFNTKENWNYIGPMPDFKYYGADSKSAKDKEKLYRWWLEQRESGYVFDFKKEIRTYCESDVEILEQGCLKFRELFMRDDVDPFLQSVTIASACNRLFRQKSLGPDTIGIVPANGYAHRDRQSHIALTWLLWEERQRIIRIEHAGNGREVNIPTTRYKADGFHAPTRTVFEFYGCAFHGCPNFYQTPTSKKKFVPGSNTKTMETAYRETLDRARNIRKAGFKLVEKWECEFRKQMVNNKTLTRFAAQRTRDEPINPRDAFFGGRTNATCLYYKKSEEGETVSYVDFCSLYPCINKYGKYPIGHPRIEKSNLTTDIVPYEGLIKCRVLPPDQLYHPVLPLRTNKKLMFPLCRTCAEKQPTSGRCKHSDEERCFEGTWVSDELKKSVSKGYRILDVAEVWHFDRVEQYVPGSEPDDKKKRGLFRAYIDHFLKMKTEASGYPPSVQTDDDQDEYIREYEEKEGIQLDKENIEVNPGMRALAKLCLNSFWGKFGQRNNLDQIDYVSHSDQLRAYLMDETKEIVSICFPSEELVQLQWRHSEEFIEATATSNPFIAAYTTAQARLKLYESLEKLDDRVLYFDTDSIIYKTKPGQEQLPTGKFLGDLTDELSEYGPDASIDEFVSAGPKNYAYTVVNARGEKVGSCCKVKGISLNAKNATAVNFETMRQLVTDPERETSAIVLKENRIARTKEHRVVTRPETKTWRVVYNKRQLQPDLTTLPWGYK